MTTFQLDALIDSMPDAAMILLVEGDWRALMGDPTSAANRRDQGARLSYRGLPVWVVSPGPSRVLTGEQVSAEGLDGLATP